MHRPRGPESTQERRCRRGGEDKRRCGRTGGEKRRCRRGGGEEKRCMRGGGEESVKQPHRGPNTTVVP